MTASRKDCLFSGSFLKSTFWIRRCPISREPETAWRWDKVSLTLARPKTATGRTTRPIVAKMTTARRLTSSLLPAETDLRTGRCTRGLVRSVLRRLQQNNRLRCKRCQSKMFNQRDNRGLTGSETLVRRWHVAIRIS